MQQLQRYEHHLGLRKRKRRPKDQDVFELSVTALASDLMHRVLTEPDGSLAVPLSNQVLGTSNRYRSPVLSKVLPDLLERMAAPEMAWLTMGKGYQGVFGHGARTTIRAAERLRSRMEEHGIGLDDLTRLRDGEVIILKREKEDHWDSGEYIDYDDTPETEVYRFEVRSINDWLAQAHIDYIGERTSVDPFDRSLRRVFNQGSFQRGGRLFGGFWQDLKKAERFGDILINDDDIVELDYGQMSVRIVYGMVGATPPEGDLYLIPGKEVHRDGFKKLMNALLFQDRLLSRYPRDTRPLFSNRMRIEEALGLLTERHPAIAHLFCKGIGMEMMFRESEILIDVLLRLQERRVVALPIHDAILVSRSDEAQARQEMTDVFTTHTGIIPVIKAEVGG